MMTPLFRDFPYIQLFVVDMRGTPVGVLFVGFPGGFPGGVVGLNTGIMGHPFVTLGQKTLMQRSSVSMVPSLSSSFGHVIVMTTCVVAVFPIESTTVRVTV